MNITYEKMNSNTINETLRFWSRISGIYLHANGEDTPDGISQYLKRNPGFSFIAKNEHDKIIGTILCGHDGRRGIIHHLAVSPGFRDFGIANKLVNLSFAKLREVGIKKVLLFVLKDSIDAQSYYEYNGWTNEDMVFVYSRLI